MTISRQYSRHCVEFLEALEALCLRYGVRLETAGYDTVLIYHPSAEDPAGIDWDDFVEVLPAEGPDPHVPSQGG